jgi:hydroxymethylpyrimidine/phosphomethylpyrimidine kinase
MLHIAEVIMTVAACFKAHAAGIPLVVDPVMVAKGGAELLSSPAVDALKVLLLPRADLLTPNLPEAEILLGRNVPDLAAMRQAAQELRQLGARAVLLKGGHLDGAILHDVLASEDGVLFFDSPRLETRHTHGTGCTLASAIATGFGQGRPLVEAVSRARTYVRDAIRAAPGFGQGHGPLNHGYAVVSR